MEQCTRRDATKLHKVSLAEERTGVASDAQCWRSEFPCIVSSQTSMLLLLRAGHIPDTVMCLVFSVFSYSGQ